MAMPQRDNMDAVSHAPNSSTEVVLRISWKEYQDLIQRIVRHLVSKEFEPDAILAIARGGLVPAVSLSHALGCRSLGVAHLQRTDSDEILALPETGCDLQWVVLPDKPFASLLVVDDIVGYGRTLEWVHRYLRQRRPHVAAVFVVLFDDLNHPKTDYCRLNVPFFSASGIRKHKWVVFPWETDGEAIAHE